jgi:DNA-binding SARP family transcriptional activator
MTSPSYRLRCFGGLFLEPESATFVQRKRLALLALLAYAGRAGLTKDRVESYLWPESDAPRARNALYQLVFAIRRQLGDASILSVNGELRLGAEALCSDVGQFREALDIDDLERAAECYAGPFLDGVHMREASEFDEWVEHARADLQTRYRETLEKLALKASQFDRSEDVVRWTRLRAVSEPLSTRAAIAHIRALDGNGDRPAALQFAQTHSALVRSQLEVEPGEEFERCVAAVRSARHARETPKERVVEPSLASD